MKKYGLAAAVVALTVSIGLSLRPFAGDFPALAPALFLWVIALIGIFVDYIASIVALIVLSIVLNAFFYAAISQQSMVGLNLAKTIVFALVGFSLCYLARSLREARASRWRLAAIVETSDDGIISKDLNGIVTSWNASAVRLFGYTPGEMIGRSILKIIPPELREEEETILRSIREGRRIDHFETERLRKDGTRIKLSLTISPLRDAEGRIVGASKIARDVTERVKMREAFIESEKLAATGRMAAAIAHEINNPLEAVTNLAFLISVNESLDESAKRYSEMLLEEINRVSNVAKRSLTFFRDTGKPAVFDVSATLDSVLDLNKPFLSQKRIEIRRDYEADCTVYGSSAEMRQVFSNLIRNAIDAAGKMGEIQVRIRARDGRWRISVADNGHGIPVDAKERLFEPFMTTKGKAGNGLGLWISRGIVEKHGGKIYARSGRIAGKSWTVFCVVLPMSRSVPMKDGVVVAVV
jgi:PAS domain S-box-containing protein